MSASREGCCDTWPKPCSYHEGWQDCRDEMQAELDEYDQLTRRLSELLTGTANALKGKPGPLTLHDWSDLPEVAQRLMSDGT